MDIEITKDMPFDQVLEVVNPIINNFQRSTDDMEKDDLYQTLVFKAWESFLKWDPDRGVKFTTFLYVNLQNEVCKIHRAKIAQKRENGVGIVSIERQIGEDPDSELEDILTAATSVESEYAVKEIQQTVCKVLHKQPKETRRICIRYLRGDKPKEIARDENVAQSKVSNAFWRFKEELRKTLRKLGYDY